MNEDRARQGVEHLQAAAFEIINAMRAFLDVAEDLVRDPASAAAFAAAIVDTARPGAPRADDGSTAAAPSAVTRIRVS